MPALGMGEEDRVERMCFGGLANVDETRNPGRIDGL